MTLLLCHPGEMGARIGARLVEVGERVLWVSATRSARTRTRAEEAGLTEVPTLAEALGGADTILSVVPPDKAEDQARSIAAHGFAGQYIDANAIAPATLRRIAEALPGADVIDGGIIGPPPTAPGKTRLYLSGSGAADVAARLTGPVLEARAIEGGIGAASALKMAYAAYTKGLSALLLAVHALAEAEGVAAPLREEWALSQPGLLTQDLTGPIAKAWRFEGEMREIAASFAGKDLPDGFHAAAAEIFARLAGFKDDWDADPAAAIAALRGA